MPPPRYMNIRKWGKNQNKERKQVEKEERAKRRKRDK